MQNNQGRGKGYQPKPNSLRRRTNARNVSFRISLRWPIYIVNSVDKTKLSCTRTSLSQNKFVSKQVCDKTSAVVKASPFSSKQKSFFNMKGFARGLVLIQT